MKQLPLKDARDYEVKTIEWPSRPGTYGPAVTHKQTGEIASGPWVSGTRLVVYNSKRRSTPYADGGMTATVNVVTPDGKEHDTYL